MFTIDELTTDYNFVSNEILTKSDKVELSTKYNVNSNKTADIKAAILDEMRNERNTRNTFSKSDISNFLRLNGIEKQNLEKESIDFVKYFRDVFYQIAIDKNLIHSSYLSSKDKLTVNRYKMATDILDSIENTDNTVVIYNSLINQTKEFYKYYIDCIKQNAERFFNNLPSRISKLEQKLNISNTINPVFRSDYEIFSNHRKYISEKRMLEAILNMGKEQYITSKVEDGINAFNKDMLSMAKRLNQYGLTSNFTISSINNDVKLFECRLISGNSKYYCRAIVAAEFSEKVTPHIRFIITEY